LREAFDVEKNFFTFLLSSFSSLFRSSKSSLLLPPMMRQALGRGRFRAQSSNRVGPASGRGGGGGERATNRLLLVAPHHLRRRRPTFSAFSVPISARRSSSSDSSSSRGPYRIAAAAEAAARRQQTALDLDHPAFAPVLSLPLSPLLDLDNLDDDDDDKEEDKDSETRFSTLVVRPLHPSDVPETTMALLLAFQNDSDPPERNQLERRLEREARRYALVDPGPWLLHSVSLPPPRAPKAEEGSPCSDAARGDDGIEGEEEAEEVASSFSIPWWSSPPSLPSSLGPGLPGSLKRRRLAELEALAEERAAAAWEEALEDALGRWLWLVAEAVVEEIEGEEGEKKKRKRRKKIVGAAALLFHDRASSLRALERMASSELGSAPQNRRRWPRPSAASMDYCLWLRERFPASGWPPRVPRLDSDSDSEEEEEEEKKSGFSELGDRSFSSFSSQEEEEEEEEEEGVFGRSASLWWVGTLPEARGRGVGAALLDACAAVAAAAGFPRVFAQVEEWSSGGGSGGGGGLGSSSARGRWSGGLLEAPWLGSEREASPPSSSSSSSSSSAVERMYRSAGFVAVPEPEPESEGGDERDRGRGGVFLRLRDGGGGGAVDRSAVLLQKGIW